MCERIRDKGEDNVCKNLMNNMKLTLEQALNALGIPDKDREQIINQLQK